TPLAYPQGAPQITSRITVFPPGSETPMHRHPMPLYVFILEGELTQAAEGKEPLRYKAGDAFIETGEWHVGRNESDKPLRLLSVYAGADHLPLSEVKPAA
ncbi:MAG TPA: cupin domain-containing protein, partial [Magnetospirillum sp.]|nr:cupin domain-containing protein [Magnetospirillum sp.]